MSKCGGYLCRTVYYNFWKRGTIFTLSTVFDSWCYNSLNMNIYKELVCNIWFNIFCLIFLTNRRFHIKFLLVECVTVTKLYWNIYWILITFLHTSVSCYWLATNVRSDYYDVLCRQYFAWRSNLTCVDNLLFAYFVSIEQVC